MGIFKEIALMEEVRSHQVLHDIEAVSVDEVSMADVVDAVESGITSYEDALAVGLIDYIPEWEDA